MATTQESRRRSIGTAMTSRRTGRASVNDINSIITAAAQKKTLKTIEPKGSLPAVQGRGEYEAPATSTGGIASPLTEADYDDREYWAEQTVMSSDGLLSFRVKPIKQITQRDANDAEVVQIFADPSAP